MIFQHQNTFPSWREHPSAWILAVGAFLTPVIGFFFALGIAPLLVIVTVALLVSGGKKRLIANFGATVVWLKKPFALALAVFLLWAGASMAWAPPSLSLMTSFRAFVMTAGSMGCGLVIIGEVRRMTAAEAMVIGRGLTGGILVGTILLLGIGLFWRIFEYFTDGTFTYLERILYKVRLYGFDLYRRDRETSILVILLWPMLLGLWKCPRLYKIAAYALVFVSVLFSVDATSKLALLGGGVIFLVALVLPRLLATIMGVVSVVVILCTPLITQHLPTPQQAFDTRSLPFSVFHSQSTMLSRLAIWHFAGEKAKEKPVIGWGIDSSRVLGFRPDGTREFASVPNPHHFFAIEKFLPPFPSQSGFFDLFDILPLHTHNNVLQIWLELGGIGAVLLAFGIGSIFFRFINPAVNKASRPFMLAQITTIAVVASASYGVWQSWWQCTLGIAVAMMCAMEKLREPDSLQPNYQSRKEVKAS